MVTPPVALPQSSPVRRASSRGVGAVLRCVAEDAARDEVAVLLEREWRAGEPRGDAVDAPEACVSPAGVVINWIVDEESAAWPRARPRPLPSEEDSSARLPRPRSDGLGAVASPGCVDRKGVERCWLALRAHFRPAPRFRPRAYDDPPRASRDDDDESRDDDPAVHAAALTLVVVLRRAGARKWNAPRSTPLSRLYRFLVDCGERFPGGFPNDRAKWRPLDRLLRTHFLARGRDAARVRVRPTCVAAADVLEKEVDGGARSRLARAAQLGREKDDDAPSFDADAANAPDEHGDRPLAARTVEWPRSVRALLERGAWPSAPSLAATSSGATALHYAAAAGSEEVVRLLLAAGADPNARTCEGEVPLHFLARVPRERGDAALAAAKLLLDAGASPDGFRDERRHSAHPAQQPQQPAALVVEPRPTTSGGKAGKPTKAAALVETPPCWTLAPVVVPAHAGHRAGAEDASAARFTPLHCAVAAGHLALLQELLRRGARPTAQAGSNAQSETDWHTALSIAGRAARHQQATQETYDIVDTLRDRLCLPAVKQPPPARTTTPPPKQPPPAANATAATATPTATASKKTKALPKAKTRKR